MTKDPIGDLFNASVPGPVPTVVVPAQQVQQPKPSNLWLIVALCIFCWVVADRNNYFDWFKRDHQEQHEEQVAPSTTGYMIFVHERKPLSVEDGEMLDIADTMVSDKLQWRSVDKDDDSAPVKKMIDFAASKGVQPPFCLHRMLDGTYRKVIPFPKTKDELLKVLK